MEKHMKVWGLGEMTQCRGINEEIRVMTNSMILKTCEVGSRSVEDGKKLKIRVPKQHLILCRCLSSSLIFCISRLVSCLNQITGGSHLGILPQDVSHHI
jgi:hypothetical protein